MERINQTILLTNEKIIFDENYDGIVPFTTIRKVYMNKDGNIEKIIIFSIWDDMSFNAYSPAKIECLDFEFDFEDPLYYCLDELLNGHEDVTIYDDHTIGSEKHMRIKKKDNLIVISFQSNKNCKLEQDKFNIFIKNIGPDSRSKIHDDKFKFRIVDFFIKSRSILLEQRNRRLDCEKILKKGSINQI